MARVPSPGGVLHHGVPALRPEVLWGPPSDVHSTAYDEWEEEADRRCLFDAPLGFGGLIHRVWCTPSARLGARLIPEIYESGLEVEGPELHLLRHELLDLQQAWITSLSDDEKTIASISGRQVEYPLLVHLIDRAAGLEAAIRLAIAEPGYLCIS